MLQRSVTRPITRLMCPLSTTDQRVTALGTVSLVDVAPLWRVRDVLVPQDKWNPLRGSRLGFGPSEVRNPLWLDVWPLTRPQICPLAFFLHR